MTQFLWRHRFPIAVALLLLVAAWEIRAAQQRAADRAEYAYRIRQDSILLAGIQRQLRDARRAVVQAEAATAKAIEAYDTARAGVTIRYVYRPVPTGTYPNPSAPRDSVQEIVVTPEFLAAGDRLRQECALLRADCATFRVWADSTINAQARIIDAQRATERVRIESRTIGCLVGAGAGLGGYTVRWLAEPGRNSFDPLPAGLAGAAGYLICRALK